MVYARNEKQIEHVYMHSFFHPSGHILNNSVGVKEIANLWNENVPDVYIHHVKMTMTFAGPIIVGKYWPLRFIILMLNECWYNHYCREFPISKMGMKNRTGCNIHIKDV